MILVADSGSTKTNWCLLDVKQEPFYFDTEGYNPYHVSADYIFQSLVAKFPQKINPASVSMIYFYGAGCFEDKAHIVNAALARVFRNANIYAELDLLGSARAVLGNQPGFAAILGTGTNSCLYDGNKITANIDSLGYLLGDEGSGFYIGKKLLGDYIRGYMPTPVNDEFYKTYKLGREAIMETVYSEKLPNRFCAAFTQFITGSKTTATYAHNIVKGAFTDFFENLVTRYDNYQQYTFNCTGSIGYAFREILTETAARYNMQVGTIIKTPMEGLVAYHMPPGGMREKVRRTLGQFIL